MQKNYLPTALLELFQPNKNESFRSTGKQNMWLDSGGTQNFMCVPVNRSLVVAEHMSNGNGRGILQSVLQTRFSAPHRQCLILM